MRTLLQISLAISLSGSLFAQFPGLTLPPSGNNQKASVTQFIGPVKITIDYSSPAVHGPDGKDRRGQIWGKLVPYGMTDLGFMGGKLSPWRGGANENTVFAVSDPVSIEGQPLAAGQYGLHLIAGQDEWTVIFSKNSSAWGSFFYDESQDALRVKVKPAKHEYREWLTYEFTARRPSEATAELQWEELAVPFNIKVDNVNDVYVTKLRQELTGGNGFNAEAYDAAAQFCAQAGTHLEDALKWADLAIDMPFAGVTNFATLSTKAQVLQKMGREAESEKIMQTAVRHPSATSQEIHQYGRRLLAEKKTQEALEIFKLNAERNGEAWPVNVGLARGYMAVGDYKKAAEYAQKAAAQAPDPINKKNLEAMAQTLAEGKPYDN
jgi:tetratricopeptide (TPR) repeat protein